ncbi:unnamed protein product [Didymodactylos carnosus]|uniref:ATPase AAA-type core domain-containing protein n=1 Tax=Didymodactylos carnosus TaxID=1234261 RepID=A0A8S2HDP5_9BILA|nr:unnamed protein product [Didymodactylos carnosus]CAF3628141.1 unnamed protein product [Didymodactylos carnosus]
MDITYYVIQPLITTIKTGNILHDCLLIVLALFCLTFIGKLSAIFIDYLIVYYLPNICKFRRIKSRYQLDVIINTQDYGSAKYCIPDEYLSILHHLYRININIKSGKRIPNITYVQTTNYGHSSATSATAIFNELDDMMNYFITGTEYICFDQYLYLTMVPTISSATQIQHTQHSCYELTIYSYKYTFIELKTIISQWHSEYKAYMKRKHFGNLYHFTFLSQPSQPPSENDDKTYHPTASTAKVTSSLSSIYFDKHLFQTNKSFDNLFFNGKQKLLKQLQFFLNNSCYYQQKGLPHSLGLLFYGFPDIDCMSNIIKKRCNLPSTSVDSDETTIEFGNDCDEYIKIKLDSKDLKQKQKLISKSILKKKLLSSQKQHDPLTLSFILNLIDGFLEQPKRLLIITTNKPEQIDPALLRPGRIDFKQEFKKCSNDDIKSILEHFYDTKLTDEEDFPDGEYSPAEIIQLCLTNNQDINETLRLLIKKKND